MKNRNLKKDLNKLAAAAMFCCLAIGLLLICGGTALSFFNYVMADGEPTLQQGIFMSAIVGVGVFLIITNFHNWIIDIDKSFKVLG